MHCVSSVYCISSVALFLYENSFGKLGITDKMEKYPKRAHCRYWFNKDDIDASELRLALVDGFSL